MPLLSGSAMWKGGVLNHVGLRLYQQRAKLVSRWEAFTGLSFYTQELGPSLDLQG